MGHHRKYACGPSRLLFQGRLPDSLKDKVYSSSSICSIPGTMVDRGLIMIIPEIEPHSSIVGVPRARLESHLQSPLALLVGQAFSSMWHRPSSPSLCQWLIAWAWIFSWVGAISSKGRALCHDSLRSFRSNSKTYRCSRVNRGNSCEI